MSAIAACYEAFQAAMQAHDQANPDHTASGIGLNWWDLSRLGFEDGETVLPGITVHGDDGVTGNFRVICDGHHGTHEDETARAVSDPNPSRLDPVYA